MHLFGILFWLFSFLEDERLTNPTKSSRMETIKTFFSQTLRECISYKSVKGSSYKSHCLNSLITDHQELSFADNIVTLLLNKVIIQLFVRS